MPDKQIADEFISGLSIYSLCKKYNTSNPTIRRRIKSVIGDINIVINYKSWTEKDDKILILLRNNGYSTREIGYGLFNRSVSAVQNRLEILKKAKKVY